MILVDTNVLVDIVSDDPIWAEWSQRHLAIAAAQDELAINDIIYAELSVRYVAIEELDTMIRNAGLVSATIPRSALFLVGKAFQRYRVPGGIKTGVLPDFFIGAHTVIAHSTLVTRDAARYRTYFPGIMLIAPNRFTPPPRRGLRPARRGRRRICIPESCRTDRAAGLVSTLAAASASQNEITPAPARRRCRCAPSIRRCRAES